MMLLFVILLWGTVVAIWAWLCMWHGLYAARMHLGYNPHDPYCRPCRQRSWAEPFTVKQVHDENSSDSVAQRLCEARLQDAVRELEQGHWVLARLGTFYLPRRLHLSPSSDTEHTAWSESAAWHNEKRLTGLPIVCIRLFGGNETITAAVMFGVPFVVGGTGAAMLLLR